VFGVDFSEQTIGFLWGLARKVRGVSKNEGINKCYLLDFWGVHKFDCGSRISSIFDKVIFLKYNNNTTVLCGVVYNESAKK
jgi:hypothetical protein